MKENLQSNQIFDNALMIAIGSGIIYLSTYLFESGVCLVYNIPDGFISVNISNVLSYASLVFYYVFLFSIPFFAVAFTFETITDKPIIKKGGFLFVCFSLTYILAFLTASLIFPQVKSITILIICGIGLVLIVAFIFILVFFNKKKNSKKATALLTQSKPSIELIFFQIKKFKGGFIALCVLLPFVSLMYGEYTAIKIDTFITFQDKKNNFVVLKKYDDYLFCKTYDERINKVGDSLVVIHLSDIHKITFGSINKDLKFCLPK